MGKIQLATIDDVNKINEKLVDMTGATNKTAGKSGFVPAPAAGNQGKFLAGDGTWKTPTNTTYSAATQSKSGLMSAADKKAHDEMVTAIGTEDISGIGDGTIKGAIAYLNENGGSGGGGGIPLAQPTSVSLTNADEAVTIKWTDPADVTLDGATLAKWSGTLVVRKAGSAPTSKTDGVVVVDSKTRDAYKTTGFKDTGLTNGTKYYYGIFPYTTGNVYTYDYTNSITPAAIYPSAATGVTAEAGNAQVKVIFTKPSDASYARIVYKKGSAPTSPTDGTSTNNVTSPFTITGLTNDSLYYAKVFTYNAKGRYTASSVVSFTPKALTIVTWANGSLEDIAKMLEAHYAGTIDVADYWAVGDTRSVDLSAMGASGIANSRNVAETHSAQTVELVILDFEHDTLTTPINGHTKAAITVQQKNCLKLESNPNYQSENSKYDAGMGSMINYSETRTNSGGWKSSARRTWCNGQYKNALPSVLQNIIKQVSIYTDNTGGGSDTASYVTTTDDYVFLPAEFEIFGARTYANSAEKNHQEQYEYFKTTSNRCKNPKWNSSSVSGFWWERSPYSSNSTYFCRVDGSGTAYNGSAGNAYGLAPAFCL